MSIDWKFWVMFAINIVGIVIMVMQWKIMKQQIPDLPSPRSAKRAAAEDELTKRLYRPIMIMGILILVGWIPYVLSSSNNVIPPFVSAWGGNQTSCSANIDTSSFTSVRDKYRIVLICTPSDSTVDIQEDTRIAISKPFYITGGMLSMTVTYDAQSAIGKATVPGMAIGQSFALIPINQDGSNIRKIADVKRDGGTMLVPGMKKDY